MKTFRLPSLLLCVTAALAFVPCSRADDRPNIVLIMADDMGFSDLGCYGGEIHTPNLDRLAERGLRFTQFYNCAVCVSTRASLLYGVYPAQAGVVPNGDTNCTRLTDDWKYSVNPGEVGLPPSEKIQPARHCVSLAEVLKAAGYRTFMTGKWHGAHTPVERGFDRYYGLLSGCCNYFNPGLRRGNEPEPGRKNPNEARPWALDADILRPYTPEPPDFYATDAFTDQAIAYLDEHGRDDRPFFLYLAYTAPHFPIQAPPEDIARYRGRYLAGWNEVRRERHEKQKQLGLIDPNWPLSPRDPRIPEWEQIDNKDEWDLKMAVYAAMIDRMDRNIGRVLDKLRALDHADNTLVLFLSDNGACAESVNSTPDIPPGPLASYRTVDAPWATVSNTPFRRFKKFLHEGGIATPLIAYWPGVLKRGGAITTEAGHVIDLMPTFCELAGADYPRDFNGEAIQPAPGRSLLPVLQGRPPGPRGDLCWELWGHQAIRTGRWKLVGCRGGAWELYDLQTDRTEQHNLAAAMPDRVEELAKRYRHWAETLNAPPPEAEPSPAAPRR